MVNLCNFYLKSESVRNVNRFKQFGHFEESSALRFFFFFFLCENAIISRRTWSQKDLNVNFI